MLYNICDYVYARCFFNNKCIIHEILFINIPTYIIYNIYIYNLY